MLWLLVFFFGIALLAKSKKPEHVLQHSGAGVIVSPDQPQNTHSKKRKRMTKRGKWGNTCETMSKDAWKQVIISIGNGATRKDAAKAAKISPQTIDAYLIMNIAAYKQIRDATLMHCRRHWPTELIEHIFDDLALGLTLKAAAFKHGIKKERMPSLYRLVRQDKAIREAYDDARELQAESFLDDVIDIADESSNDWGENGRANHEVVNRSKLRIDTRWRTMGAMVKKRFGEHKHVDVEGNIFVNHIALLTGARKRLENRKGAMIDNETGKVEATT